MSEPARSRIFINAMNSLQGGGQTYLRHLIHDVPQAEVYVAAPQALVREISTLPYVHFLNAERWNSGFIHRTLWENLILPVWIRKLKIDVYFSAGGLLPFRRLPCKTVVAFRNMLPFSAENRRKFPLGFKRFRYALLKWGLSRAFKTADAIIFISHFAKQVIDHELPKRRGISQVIYHGVGENYRRTQSLNRPTDLPFEYVLYVSILNVYKAQLEVVEAWSELRKCRSTQEKLVFVGPEYGPYAEKVRARISELKLDNEILLLGPVDYQKLPAYYHHAKINIFASTCENCPNILLEALASETPVLCSNVEPMPEIAEKAAIYFSPQKPQELSAALMKVLDDDQLRRQLASLAAQRAKKFSWDNTRMETWNLLKAVI